MIQFKNFDKVDIFSVVLYLLLVITSLVVAYLDAISVWQALAVVIIGGILEIISYKVRKNNKSKS